MNAREGISTRQRGAKCRCVHVQADHMIELEQAQRSLNAEANALRAEATRLHKQLQVLPSVPVCRVLSMWPLLKPFPDGLLCLSSMQCLQSK